MNDKEILHYGVKGMRWGVRKDKDSRLQKSEYATKNFQTNENVYRILSNEGARKLKDIAYVSSNDIDNKRYIHILNHTISARLIKSARYETQLVLGPTKKLKAPSIKTAELEMSKLAKTNPVVKKFIKNNEIYFGENPSAKTIAQMINTALVDDNVLFDGSIALRKEVKSHFQKLGFNALLDQNDIREGLAKTPLIVFDPEKTLRVISRSKIDDLIKREASKTYKETKQSNYIDNF